LQETLTSNDICGSTTNGTFNSEIDMTALTSMSMITKAHHRYHLQETLTSLKSLQRRITNLDFAIELAAEDLRYALFHIGNITGHVGVEEVLDKIFQDFCIGNGTLEFSLNNPKACQNTNGGTLLTTYLNTKAVQQAIGAKPAKWAVCSNKVNYHAQGENMVLYYEKFFQQKPGFAVLVYSGDIDIMTVPFATTQPCLAEMNRPATSNWQPWYVNGWTAGYVQTFDTYTYVTVKGAGHEAPGYQPLNSLNMFSRFLTTQSLNTTSSAEQQLLDKKQRLAKYQLLKNRPLSQSQMLRHHNIRP